VSGNRFFELYCKSCRGKEYGDFLSVWDDGIPDLAVFFASAIAEKLYAGWLDKDAPGLDGKLADAEKDLDLPPAVRWLAHQLRLQNPKRNDSP